MKNYLKAFGITSIGILGLTLIITILHYFNLLGDGAVDVIKFVIGILSVVVGGFIIGKSSSHKGWLSGLKLGGMFVSFIFLLTLIFRLGLGLGNLLYYLIIIGSSVLGSMIGISTVKKR